VASKPRNLPRHIASVARTALADTRAVAIVGPRQAGKSTLVHAGRHPRSSLASQRKDTNESRRAPSKLARVGAQQGHKMDRAISSA